MKTFALNFWFRAASGMLLGMTGLPAILAQNVVPVSINGDPANRIDLVILGDGYTSAELPKFAADAAAFVSGAFAQQPYNEYQRYFNIRRIDVASQQSGASHPELTSQIVNNAFGSTYNCGGIVRLICVNYSAVSSAISILPQEERDLVLIIVNDPTYGGSGGSFAVASTHPDAVEIVLHELGHAFGLLADEYGGPPPPNCDDSVEPFQADATKQTDRATTKWGAWIDVSTPTPTFTTGAGIPGLYPGAAYCDNTLFRPTYNSKMRSLGMPFEQINTEQLVRRYYSFTSPIDSIQPASTSVSLTKGDSQSFALVTPLPLSHSLNFVWKLDGAIVTLTPGFVLNTSNVSVGTHTVSVTVSDPTSMVRNDPSGLLQEQGSWNVVVAQTSLATPTVTFTGAPASAAYRATFIIGATTNASTAAVITASGACSINGNTVTMSSGTGTCSLTANWAADSNYSAASLTQSTTAVKATPSVTFTGTPASAVYHATFTVATTTNASTAAVITASGACSVNGKTVTMTSGTGTCSLTANWPADSNYSAASAARSITAAKAIPTVTFTGAPATAPNQATFTVAATTSASTAAVITATGACSINGTTVTMTSGAGTCGLAANWAADSNYSAASATQSTAATVASTVGAAYGFNQGSGSTATDSSGNGISGTVQGTTWTPSGKYGKALSFNGNSSYVNLGNPSLLQSTGSMTWSAWVFATGNPNDDGQIISRSNDSSGWQLKTSPDTGPRTFGVAISANNSRTHRYSTTVVRQNNWYYVTGVYNAATRTLDIYVNGVRDNGVLIGTVPASQAVPSVNVNIGRRPAGYYFKGTIDEVRIYNRALSQAEIQADMATPIN